MRVRTKTERRARIRLRQRQRIRGTAARPRLSVFRSLAHIAIQAIDDEAGRTVAAASSTESEVRALFRDGAGGGNVAGAAVIGAVAAERLLKHGVRQVVFDRGGVRYHGRVRRVADALRAAGLEF